MIVDVDLTSILTVRSGTGLFLGPGGALANGGPLGLFMGYAFMGSICYSVMVSARTVSIDCADA